MTFLAVVKAEVSPRSLTLLTILSLILSPIILAISAANDSTVLLCLDVVATAQTVVYHLVVVNVWRRRTHSALRIDDIDVIDQTKSTTTDLFLTQSIGYCAVILALWSGAFVFAAETALVGRKAIDSATRNAHSWNNGIQISIVVLIGMELGVMVLYLRSCFLLQFSRELPDHILDPLLSKSCPGDVHDGKNHIKKYIQIDDHKPIYSKAIPRPVNSPIQVLHKTLVRLPPPALIRNEVKSPYSSWIFLTPKREST